MDRARARGAVIQNGGFRVGKSIGSRGILADSIICIKKDPFQLSIVFLAVLPFLAGESP